jgi:hypothetical protein
MAMKIGNIEWSKDEVSELIRIRHDVQWNEKFNAKKGKARQLSLLWDELAVFLSAEKTGLEARSAYNYLVLQFKKYNIIAKRTGEGAVKWPYYKILKETIINNPVVSPVCIIDNGIIEQSDANEDERIDSAMSELSNSTVIKNKPKNSNLETIMKTLSEISNTRNNLISDLINNKNSESLKEQEKEIKQLREDIKHINENVTGIHEMLSKFLKKNE